MEILIATNNDHKVQEYKEMLKELNIQCLSLKDLNIHCDPEETGKTFQENAIIKGLAASKFTDKVVLADDSGLIIDAYPDLLGVYSHRFLKDASYKEKCNEVLKMLKDKPRTARFICHISLFNLKEMPIEFEGICEGTIATKYQGENGFGYDPIFIPKGYKQTMAELPLEEKNRLSHRGQAVSQLIQYLKERVKNENIINK